MCGRGRVLQTEKQIWGEREREREREGESDGNQRHKSIYTREGEEGGRGRPVGCGRLTTTKRMMHTEHEAHNYKRYSIFPSLFSSLAFFGACAMDRHRNVTNRSDEFRVYIKVDGD